MGIRHSQNRGAYVAITPSFDDSATLRGQSGNFCLQTSHTPQTTRMSGGLPLLLPQEYMMIMANCSLFMIGWQRIFSMIMTPYVAVIPELLHWRDRPSMSSGQDGRYAKAIQTLRFLCSGHAEYLLSVSVVLHWEKAAQADGKGQKIGMPLQTMHSPQL